MNRATPQQEYKTAVVNSQDSTLSSYKRDAPEKMQELRPPRVQPRTRIERAEKAATPHAVTSTRQTNKALQHIYSARALHTFDSSLHARLPTSHSSRTSINFTNACFCFTPRQQRY
jgi:hypothetical protein